MRRIQQADDTQISALDERPTKRKEPMNTDQLHFYCINLRHRTDRWNAFSNQPVVKELQANYTFERFDAVQGSTIDIPNDPRVSMRTKRNIHTGSRRDHEDLNTAGGVGCYLSHMEVWKKIANNPEPFGIIFEDDTRLNYDFLETLQDCMKDLNLLPETPDVWTFSYGWDFYYKVKDRPSPIYEKENHRGPWVYNTCPGGLNGYLVTKEGARKLLEHAFPIDMHVDLYICLCVDLKRVTCVSHKRLIVHGLSEGIKSDIQLPAVCTICDIPTNFSKRGMVLVHMPLTMIGLLACTGLLYLNSFVRKPRRFY